MHKRLVYVLKELSPCIQFSKSKFYFNFFLKQNISVEEIPHAKLKISTHLKKD